MSTQPNCAACGELGRKVAEWSHIETESGPVRVCKPCDEQRWWEQPGAFKPKGLGS